MARSEDDPSRRSGAGDTPRQKPSRSGVPPENGGAVTAVEFVNVVLRYRRVCLLLPIAVAVLVVSHGLVQPRTYSSEMSFMPAGDESQVGRLAGIAARLGVDVSAGAAGSRSPRFYADLLRSRELLHDLVKSEYRPSAREGVVDEQVGGDGVTLVRYYETGGADSAVRVERAARILERRIDVTTRPETGVVTVTVRDHDPAVVRQISDRLLLLLNKFNNETRQSQATEERRFIEERMQEARRELLAVEDSLKLFLERNRSYEGSPQLRFEHDRLQRRVSLQQQVYTSLAQSYEQAKIDEVRNTPVITVVDPPERPARAEPRGLLLRSLLGLGLGALLALVWAFSREAGRNAKDREPNAYREFQRLKRETRKDLETWIGRVSTRLRRLAGRRSRGGGR